MMRIIVIPHYDGTEDFSVLIRRVITDEIRKKQTTAEQVLTVCTGRGIMDRKLYHGCGIYRRNITILQPTTNTIYNTALYCCHDGFSDRDSSSIENQRDMLTRYCNQHGIIIYDYFVDDGYTRTNFDRPSFQRMIGDIENAKINFVITKDQSRPGRNRLEAGYFMEMFFQEHGVRYITVSDGVDTINQSTLDFAPFRNLLYDMYAKDVSTKSKTSLLARQKAGKYVCTQCLLNNPYSRKTTLMTSLYGRSQPNHKLGAKASPQVGRCSLRSH